MKDSPLVHLTSAGNNAEAALLRAYLGARAYVHGKLAKQDPGPEPAQRA